MKIKTIIEVIAFLSGALVAIFGPYFGIELALFYGVILMVISLIALCMTPKSVPMDFFAPDAIMAKFGGDGITCATCHEAFTKSNPEGSFGVCKMCCLKEEANMLGRKETAKHGPSNAVKVERP